jgi:hypothetical protein
LGEEPIFNAVASPAPTRGFGARFGNVNWPLVGIVAAAVVLVIVLLFLIFGPKGSSEDVASLPVSAATDASSESSSASNAAAPTSFTFSYNVNSGTTTWIEVYIDGEKQLAENVEGPATKTFTTSGVLEFICADPTGVKAVQDGKDIPLTPNDSGVVDIKIDFNDVLAAWQAEHGMGSSSAASSSSSASNLRGIDNEARQAANESSASNEESDEESDEEGEDEESSDEEEYTDEESEE